MLDLNQLRIFHAAATARNFTRAAAAVHLTQPGVSKHIRQIEEQLGLPLFDRLGKHVELTEAGHVLLAATQQILTLAETAEQRIADLKGLRGGTLSLGASFPVGVYLLPAQLAAFRRDHPAVQIRLEISLTEKVLARVLANKLDIGLVSHEVNDARLASRVFYVDELIAIVPPGHPWARKRRVRPADMAVAPMILAAQGAGTRAALEERLAQQQIALGQVTEFGNMDGVKRAVEAGLGVSVQARSGVQRELASGHLVGIKLAGIDARLPYLLVRRKDKRLANAARAFVNQMLSGWKPAPTVR